MLLLHLRDGPHMTKEQISCFWTAQDNSFIVRSFSKFCNFDL